MSKKNRHGLSRSIPAGVQREVRQRCGFGCVICGLAFYDYEHFDPDFADALEHNPAGITLLCSQCNQKRARNRLSRETVALANLSPKCLEQGFSHEMFDFHSEPITVKFAGVTFHNCKNLIVLNGYPILKIDPPAEESQPIILSGFFTDTYGRKLVDIENNQFSASTETWDVHTIGKRIIFRRGLGEILLSLRTEPPDEIVIERLDMFSHGVALRGDEDRLEISVDRGQSWSRFAGIHMSNCETGIRIDTHGFARASNDEVWDAE
ncbi:hypothetical protein [Alcaligenes faecalis]|jgi:hypothetical protein|uniref:hypothetical protein n=1 Tax=Alcaligenes faecalis TaxID=511 RepID=UPI002AA6FD35|nr:hypothetical protein [Alcaligenes faecalis]